MGGRRTGGCQGGPRWKGGGKRKERDGGASAGPDGEKMGLGKTEKAQEEEDKTPASIFKIKTEEKKKKEIHMGSKIHIKICFGIHMNYRIFRK